jgi:hypothetical protein
VSIPALIAALIVTALVGRALFRVIFDDAADFWDCVKFSFTPDLISMFRGRYLDDWHQSMKLSLFLLAAGGAGGLTYWGIASIGN